MVNQVDSEECESVYLNVYMLDWAVYVGHMTVRGRVVSKIRDRCQSVSGACLLEMQNSFTHRFPFSVPLTNKRVFLICNIYYRLFKNAKVNFKKSASQMVLCTIHKYENESLSRT